MDYYLKVPRNKKMFDFSEFLNYCESFYGVQGIYKMNASRTVIALAATDVFLEDEDGFQADSTDREKVRKILEEKFGLKEEN